MFARVEIAIGEAERVMSVPREAVRDLGIRMVVYRVDPLPAGFVYEPPQAPPGRKGGPPRKGPPGEPAQPDSVATPVEIRVTRELDREMVIEPVEPGALGPGSEIVITGNSRLQEGSLLKRLNPEMSGAG